MGSEERYSLLVGIQRRLDVGGSPSQESQVGRVVWVSLRKESQASWKMHCGCLESPYKAWNPLWGPGRCRADVRLFATPWTVAYKALCPWNFPGKNTGVGCHFLLQCMKVESQSEVAQLCPTLCDPIDGSPPGSAIPGILQARTLEWVAISFSNA